MTKIEWTNGGRTWNPVLGCSRISPGCNPCYAEGQVHRGLTERHRGLTILPTDANGKSLGKGPRWTGLIRMVPEVLDAPLRRKKPTTWFVNSLSDLFHEELVGYAVEVKHVTGVAIPYWTVERVGSGNVGRHWRIVDGVPWSPSQDGQSDEDPLVFFDEQGAQAKAQEIRDFHERGRRFIAAVFGVMAATPQHTYQILTKRPGKAREWFAWLLGEGSQGHVWQTMFVHARDSLDHSRHLSLRTRMGSPWPWPLPNVWLGVSVEDQPRADERIPILRELPAAIRFLSCEPLLGETRIMPGQGDGAWLKANDGRLLHRDHPETPSTGGAWSLSGGLDWVITGGQSGPKSGECDIAWLRSIVAKCQQAGTPVFVKQLGAHPVLDGRPYPNSDAKGGNMTEWPEDLRVREMPEVDRVHG